jgi:hypothetical protein
MHAYVRHVVGPQTKLRHLIGRRHAYPMEAKRAALYRSVDHHDNAVPGFALRSLSRRVGEWPIRARRRPDDDQVVELDRFASGILAGAVGRPVVTQKDRLLRFGAELVFVICHTRGVEVVIIN